MHIGPLLEARRPFLEARRPFLEARRPFLEAHRPFLEAHRPFLEARRPFLEARRPMLGQRFRRLEGDGFQSFHPSVKSFLLPKDPAFHPDASSVVREDHIQYGFIGTLQNLKSEPSETDGPRGQPEG